MKSANTDSKVLTLQVDLAELVALLTLYHICKEIELVHQPIDKEIESILGTASKEIAPLLKDGGQRPGACILLYTQEPFLHEMSESVQINLGEPLHRVEHLVRYQDQLKELVGHFTPQIELRELRNLQALYNQAVKQTAVEPQNLDKYKIFMKQELKTVRLEAAARLRLSENQAQPPRKAVEQLISATAGSMAKCYLHGSAVLRSLLSNHILNYSSYIRLSVNMGSAGDDVSIKLGVALVYGSRGTPWHNALVVCPTGAYLEAYAKKKSDKIDAKQIAVHLSRQEYLLGGLKLAYLQE